MIRCKNVLLGAYVFWFCRHSPERAKAFLLRQVPRRLGLTMTSSSISRPTTTRAAAPVPGAGQRSFKAIKAGQVSIVTDHIETFTERGIRLRSGTGA